MIKKLDKYLLKSYVRPLLITFIISDFVLLMQFFWLYFDELVGKGLEWYILAELLFYTSATFVPLALPIGILLASLMAFGNLGENYELIALKSAGISLKRIQTPVALFTVFLSIFALFYSDQILPKANLKFTSVFYDIRNQKLAFNLTEGVYYKDIEGYAIKVNKKDPDDKTIYGVIVHDHSDGKGNSNVTFAEKGIMEIVNDGANLKLTLYDGYNYDDEYSKEKKEAFPLKRIKFEKEEMLFDLSQFDLSRTDDDLRRKHYRNFTNSKLRKVSDSLKYEIDTSKLYNNAKNNYFEDVNISEDFNNISNLSKSDFRVTTKVVDETTNLNSQEIDIVFDKDFINSLINKRVLNNAIDKSSSQKRILNYLNNNISYVEAKIRQNRVELNRRIALAFACLVLFFVGAPLGAIIRKGGLGMPLVLAVVIFIFYHIILTAGQKAAMKGSIDPFFGMWLANFIILPFGILLTQKATYDSKMLDKDSWVYKIMKFKVFQKNNK
ncbi:MAG: LptF/LptG family permease [Bacteroidales bacterium]